MSNDDKWRVEFADSHSSNLVTQSKARQELQSQLEMFHARGGKVKSIKFGKASRPPMDEWGFMFSKRHKNERG